MIYYKVKILDHEGHEEKTENTKKALKA